METVNANIHICILRTYLKTVLNTIYITKELLKELMFKRIEYSTKLFLYLVFFISTILTIL